MPNACFGRVSSWSDKEWSGCNVPPTVKPRKLKPQQLTGVEAALPSTICPVPATGDHTHALCPESVGKTRKFSAPFASPAFAHMLGGEKRGGMTATGQGLHDGRRRCREQGEISDKMIFPQPANTSLRADVPANNAEEKPGEVPTRSDASLMSRKNHHTLLVFSLVGVFILCLWTFYFSKDFVMPHEGRPLQRDHVGNEDLTIAPDDSGADSERFRHDVSEITVQTDVEHSSGNNSTEDELEGLKVNTFRKDYVP